MDHIIRKYTGKKGVQNPFDFGELDKMTEEQRHESLDQYYGLEEIAKHLGKLSNGRLNHSDIRAP